VKLEVARLYQDLPDVAQAENEEQAVDGDDYVLGSEHRSPLGLGVDEATVPEPCNIGC
jgi:hypothetical protein